MRRLTMRRLTLRERDAIPIGTDDGLSEAEAAAFARLQPSLPAGSVNWQHRAIRFGPFCGVLRAGNVTVELLPKIEDGQDSNEGARGLLVAMLRITGNLIVSNAGESTLGQQQLHLLDQFILDFCSRVRTMLRGGAIARYQDHKENLNALRGRLILTNHLLRNSFDRSHLFCSFDERTIDNPHNRALKAVLSALRSSAVSVQTRATVTTLLHHFDNVALYPVTPRDIARLIFDRMTNRWKPIFERAAWLLQGLFPDVRSGNIDGTCLLFNMERLFEAFLVVKVRQAWRGSQENNFKIVSQGPQKNLARSDSGPAFSLRPDVTLMDDDVVVRIFDAKWKRLDPQAPSFGVSPSDAYQLAVYASRYRCERVALIYPSSITRPPGLVERYRLAIPGAPILEIYAFDIRKLASGGPLPVELHPSVAS
ncbi:5-methylcytosine-specific restriction enzyme subunit McrC [Nitrosospira multiformis]|uniref:5-methylcytosine-specific restriction enzyme subunit McrC n=1 Tax=Nitrosospira multiformis TaxID=1231 RepID=A0A1H8KH52_9PROT|nr:restriction endonuclease [Nitrosospira multiformis]SEN92289.1 5-methylcytosine-specific restriction enzyme subunit McrC [Nitrosospira multiformis]